MRTSLWIALVLTVLYAVFQPPLEPLEPEGPATAAAAAPSESPVPAASASAPVTPDPAPVRLRVLNSRGVATTLVVDEKTEVLVVASWCSVTRRLNKILNDPRGRSYLAGKRLVYLFRYDELDRMARSWVRDGDMTQEEADRYVALRPAGPRLVYPEFLNETATRRIYYFDDAHPMELTGYPSAFSGPPNKFLLNYGVWMSRNLGMPKDVKDRLFAAYPAGGA